MALIIFIAAAGPQNEECAIEASAFCELGALITDLAEVIEYCSMMKVREKTPKP